MSMIFCRGCGKEIHETAIACPHCGAPQSKSSAGFGKKQSTAFLLAFFLGGFGGHRFYLGNIGLGLLYLFTFGLLGIGAIIDVFNLGFMRAEIFAAKYNNGVTDKPIGVWAKVLALMLPALFILGIISAVGGSAYKDYKQRHDPSGQSDKYSELATTPPAQLSPTGELAAMFNLMSENTDLQRENKLKEITGKVVEWTLPVYEVAKEGDVYKIQTASNDTVGTFVYVSPRNDADKTIIEALKTGDQISIKGIIEGDLMRHLEIKPAILFQPGNILAPIEAQQTTNSSQPTTISVAESAPENMQTPWKPSFDCTKASSFSEVAICSDSLLGKLDGALSENYRYMLAADIGDGAKSNLKITQKKWLSERNSCTDNQCLTATYRQRIDEICDYPVISGMHPTCTYSSDIQ